MLFSDIVTYLPNKYIEFEIETDNHDTFETGDFIRISSNTDDNIAFVSKIGDSSENLCECRFINKKYKYSFEEKSKGAYYCQVSDKRKQRLSVLMIYDLIINYEDDLNKKGIVIAALDTAVKNISVDDLNDLLTLEYSIQLGNDTFFIMAKNINSRQTNSFTLVDVTRGKALSVSSKTFAEIDSEHGNASSISYVIESSERPFLNKNEYSYALYNGNIRFEDKTKLHRLEEITKGFITDGGNAYVNAWKLYAEKQYELEVQNRDAAGVMHFTSAEQTDDHTISFIVNNEDSIINFLQKARKANGNIGVVITQTPKKSENTFTTIAIMSDRYIPGTHRVECEIEYSDTFVYDCPGYIQTDIIGCEVVYKRRMEAFDAIQRGASANGALSYLLDGRTVNNYQDKDLNDSVKLDEKVINQYFGNNPPNPSQRKAIEIAIKTPDFAVIQGPPGTGKTKVIKTIHALLQSQQKNKDVQKDKYLLTAYQRDATKNMAKGVDEEFGLPIIAYYGNKNLEGKADSNLEKWCDEKADYIIRNNPGIAFCSKRKTIILFIMQMRDTILGKCTLESAISAIEQIVEYTNDFVRDSQDDAPTKEEVDLIATVKIIKNKCLSLKRRLASESLSHFLYFASVFPTSEEEFSDNGIKLVNSIIKEYSALDYISSIRQIIQDLKACSEDGKRDYAKLRSLKIDLILETSKLSELYQDEREDILSAVNELVELLKHYRFNKKEEIISEYLYSLYPGEELNAIIEKYQNIVAATHQYSHKNYKDDYHDVLIDEAARSCPADLMIPLACARNRIILVGDHYQLPQYIEDEVLKSINPDVDGNDLFDGNTPEAVEAKYRLSMFEYMIDKVQNLCRIDPKHERVVTLDVQYRMAPPIGSLVSKHFYHGRLKNADSIPPEHFRQDFPGIAGKNLIWIDANMMGNEEQRSESRSIYRTCEAEIIAKKIHRMIEGGWDYTDNDDLNRIGVITFYSRQKAEIRRMLIDYLGYEIADSIEVGTVDSFQGKEFGIVFLSLVRSNSYDELGFIESKNRMCVALSRSIKCLIAVGDSGILKYADAEKKIPALIDFYNLCKNAKEGDPYELQYV